MLPSFNTNSLDHIGLATFTELNEVSVCLNNALCERDVSFGIFIGELESFINYRSCYAVAEYHRYGVVLDFTVQGMKGRIFFNQALLDLFFYEFDFHIEFAILPRQLQEAAVFAVLERLASVIGEPVQQLTWTWDTLSSNDNIQPYELAMCFEIVSPHGSIQSLLTFEGRAFDLLMNFFEQSEPWYKGLIKQSWKFPVKLLVGYQSLMSGEVSELDERDVILLNTWGTSLDECVLWLSPQQVFLIESCEQGWKVKEQLQSPAIFLNQEEMSMSESEHTQHWSNAELSESIKQLPVQLIFELGRTQLSLEELDSIAPGYVFDLGLNKAEPVVLHANGIPIGRCEIVEISGRLGARLTHIQR